MKDLSEFFNKNYAWEWYSYGLEKKNDPIIKFTMHWIALSWLYGDYSGNGNSERARITAFCRAKGRELSSFDAFKQPEIEIFLQGPVVDPKNHSEEHKERCKEIHDKVVNGSECERIENLLLTFYQVRCNLFHGQKSLHDERDIALVENSSVLLQGYLDAVLNYNKKTSFIL